jgi:hypothetical protein
VPDVVRLLDWIPVVARWSADRYFERMTGRRLPQHIKTARINRSTGAILFRYDPPVDQGGWLDDWESRAVSGFFLGMAKLFDPEWCVPTLAFHHFAPRSSMTLWVLVEEDIGRGIVHIV